MEKALIVLLIIAVILQGVATSLPLVLLILILLAVKVRSSDVFLLAFISGIVLDIILVHPLGASSVFFLIVLLVIFLYERKYELSSLIFVLSVTAAMSLVASFLFPTPQRFLQVILSIVINGLLFSMIQFLTVHKKKGYQRA